jgi:hypothetical protein
MPTTHAAFVLALALASLAAPAARAAPPDRRGFEVGADLGAGWVRSSARQNGITQAVNGVGAAYALSVSYGDRPGLMLGLESWGTAVYGPELETVAPSSGSGLGFHAWGFGPRLRWMSPAGVFVAATPSVTRVTLSDNDQAGFDWEWGLGLRLAAGKVWLVGERWTLGVAGAGQLSFNQQAEPASPRWRNLGLGLVMTAGWR